MARHARIQFEGAIYHVTFRGNERRAIFRDDTDRVRFLERLGSRVPLFDIRLYLYCLMENHVHLLLETPRGNLSAFMGSLLTSYATYFNVRHRRSGHLTQGRYSSPLVEGNAYLLKLSRYVHLNPVCTKEWRDRPTQIRVAALRRYRWSTYRSYIGGAAREPYVAYEPMLALMEWGGGRAEGKYRRFVEAGLVRSDEELETARDHSALAIGSAEFAEQALRRHDDEGRRRIRREDQALRRAKRLIDPAELLRVACSYFGVEAKDVTRRRYGDRVRPVLASLLTQYAGLTQRAVAEILHVRTGVAVCQQLKRVRSEAGSALRNDLRAIEQMLNI